MSTIARRAVIGGGVAGLTAAYLLARAGPVTLFEAADRLGGHAHTHRLSTPDGGALAVDSGFIVFDPPTYPWLTRLFGELGIRDQPTDMSLSIRCDGCGLEYSGGQGPRGLFAQPRRLLSLAHWTMLAEIPRFHRAALAALDDGDDRLTWGEFLDRHRFRDHFVSHFAIPFVSCVWSCDHRRAADYPAVHLFRFLQHHDLLTVRRARTWRTVVGGSAAYVDALRARLPDVRVGCPVAAISRHADGVDVTTADTMTTTFDQVVVATHADDAARLLLDADDVERSDLGAIGYSENETWLHRDASVLPKAAAARASWNYRLPTCRSDGGQVLASYWMNRLQRLPTDEPLVVTLNPGGWVDRESVVASMTYRHPVFTAEAVAAGRRLRAAGGPRLAFAGAHLGWGFHEDGCRSGVEAAARLGASW